MADQEWAVTVAARAPEGERTDHAPVGTDAFMDQLAKYDGSLSVGNDYWSATIVLGSEGAGKSVVLALKVIHEMARSAEMPDWPLVEVRSVTVEEQGRQLGEPNFPNIVGASEVMGLLDVSRQRLAELRRTDRFPKPIVELAAGPIWLRSAIDAFIDNWDRRPGRRWPPFVLSHQDESVRPNGSNWVKRFDHVAEAMDAADTFFVGDTSAIRQEIVDQVHGQRWVRGGTQKKWDFYPRSEDTGNVENGGDVLLKRLEELGVKVSKSKGQPRPPKAQTA